MVHPVLTVLLQAAIAPRPAPHAPPHIVILFVDNLGWANVGYHRPPALDPSQLSTPNIDALAAAGMELDRHYTYKFCSPSRSSLMSGTCQIPTIFLPNGACSRCPIRQLQIGCIPSGLLSSSSRRCPRATDILVCGFERF